MTENGIWVGVEGVAKSEICRPDQSPGNSDVTALTVTRPGRNEPAERPVLRGAVVEKVASSR